MEDEMVVKLENWESTSASNVISLAIVGKTGNGKSATGNTILGRETFTTEDAPYGVTFASELRSVILKDGRVVNVIDTPGLCSFDSESEFIGREIVKCVDLAKDGLHAVLMVFPLFTRFTHEEQSAIQNMKILFGERIVDYMIVVFTGGDKLEHRRKTLNEYISICPEAFKNFIRSCKNRVVVFDNITTDKIKIEAQVKKLFDLVDSVIANNGGMSFSSEIFALVKENNKLKFKLEKVKKELVELQAIKLKVEEAAKEVSKHEEIQELKEELKRNQEDLKRVREEFQKFRTQARSNCVIL